jgi:hypothetical protein
MSESPISREPSLSAIRILYRDQNLTLWGLPFLLRAGQSPKDLDDAGNRGGWIYLGATSVRDNAVVGWFGGLVGVRRFEVSAYLLARRDAIPMNHFEWTETGPS